MFRKKFADEKSLQKVGKEVLWTSLEQLRVPKGFAKPYGFFSNFGKRRVERISKGLLFVGDLRGFPYSLHLYEILLYHNNRK